MEELAAAPATALQHDRGSLTLASGWPPASPQRRKGGRNPGTGSGRDSAAARSTTVKCRRIRRQMSPELPSSVARTSVKYARISMRASQPLAVASEELAVAPVGVRSDVDRGGIDDGDPWGNTRSRPRVPDDMQAIEELITHEDIDRELDNIAGELRNPISPNLYVRLHSAQRALAWVSGLCGGGTTSSAPKDAKILER